MAKSSSSTALAEKPLSEIVTAVAPRAAASSDFDTNDLRLPRAHLYQGLPDERKRYGKHEPGDWVNTLTQEKISPMQFMPIAFGKQFIKWNEPRGTGFAYSTTDKARVPVADLQWDGDQPPACTEYITVLAVFVGESFPVLLSFSGTSLAAGKTLYTLDKVRGNKGSGLYTIETKEKQNDKGAWLGQSPKSLGNPPAALVELASQFAGLTEVLTEKAAEAVAASTPDASEFEGV
jgi:hypothetical protein